MSDCPFPLLTSGDKPFYPPDGRCPVCGADFRHGVAYLSAGALLLSDDGQDSVETSRLRAFFHIGFHGSDTEMRDSSDVPVVEGLAGGQFDLSWCSVRCMREWLLGLLREVECRVQQGQTPDQV